MESSVSYNHKMAAIETLFRKRASVKAKLTIFSNFLVQLETKYADRKITDEFEVEQLESRLERFVSILDEFEDIQSQIEELCDENGLDTQLNERESFDSKYHNLYSRAKTLHKQNLTKNVDGAVSICSGSLNNINLSSNLNHLKLPPIHIPTFNGEYDKWIEFRDTFNSLIHLNDSLPPIHKFHYLRAFIGQRVAEIIASLEFSTDNYDVAWDLICSRFNNDKSLVQNHVKALFNLDKIQKESASSLRKLSDDLSKHLRALHSLNQPTNHWDTLVIYLVTSKLDDVTLRYWETERALLPNADLEAMKLFLKKRSDLLETLESSKHVSASSDSFKKTYANRMQLNKDRHKQQNESRSFLNTNTVCSFCKENHYIQDCSKFVQLTVKERNDQAIKRRLCFNCLRSNHSIKQCVASSCRICKGRHHTLLHIEKEPIPTSSNLNPVSMGVDLVCENNRIDCTENNVNLTTNLLAQCNQVFLSTVLVQVFDRNNHPVTLRALLDAGSQSSFVTLNVLNKLGISCEPVNIRVGGLNGSESKVSGKASFLVQSQISNFSRKISCLVVPHITGCLPNFRIDPSLLQIPNNIKLADPQFSVSRPIDMLLGADCFWDLICVGQIKLGNSGPYLQKTKLGWIVAGQIASINTNLVQCNLSRSIDIDKGLTRFWELEEVETSKPLSKNEKLCEEHFQNTFKRDKDGHFLVTIPLKDDPGRLGDSFETAKRRFINLERRFLRDDNFKQEYHRFIIEYQTLGHMSKVDSPHLGNYNYYMPHHGVVKESSSTTKLRVVFDASCPSSSGISLNDLQLVGPTIQSDLFSILISFRQHTIVVSADVEKMYRMCRVVKEQRPLQRILWRDNPDEPIGVYELNTVTYGTASAAFLAIRCLFQLGIETEASHPKASKIIKRNFYVDDLLMGADTEEEAILLANEISVILSKAGFHLRKWASNSICVSQGIQTGDQREIIDFGNNENTKTLGMFWNGHDDYFFYNITNKFSKNVTKRHVLSEISQIFDPLGLLSPCIIRAKLLLRDIWLEKLDWDHSLTQPLHTRWLNFRDNLHTLNNLKIPRQITCRNVIRNEIHGFCDASSQAYGACVYLKSWNKNNDTFVNLIAAKSKVAPLKTQSIPRLELTGALLLANLVTKILNSLDISIDRIVLWTDSTIVLGWLRMEPNQLQVFVANRISMILELTQVSSWRHVPTADNPADCVSRGISCQELLFLNTYWEGPNWLLLSEEHWPQTLPTARDLPELRKAAILLNINLVTDSIDFTRYSSLTKLERVIAYCIRFIRNCSKQKIDRTFGCLRATEIKEASLVLAGLSQKQTFGEEIVALASGNDINPKSKLMPLSPFLDHQGILRVGGRLANANLKYAKKHPIILSSKHRFTKMLFEREHIRLLHSGPQLTLSSVRQSYWPLLGRNLARQTIHKCIRCYRARPKNLTPVMGNLPSERIEPAPPFYNTGVDYAGPFLIKDRNGRGCKVSKAYISVFVCFATKAIHLELVSDLTTEAFLAALRRFVSRRGKPCKMHSDNGTNFVGASAELKRLAAFFNQNGSALTEILENEGISWCFIPPRGPHFGGLWEAGVKSAKSHLLRVAGNAILTYEQFYTLLVQIEAVLNSRPLFPLSNDPNDLTPITPAHFLIGRPLVAAPDVNLHDVRENRLNHYQRIQQLQQHFWRRWSTEYLTELQCRNKWTKRVCPIAINDLVVIIEDKPPLKWALGRIVSLHPGTDGITRVVTVRTAGGVLKRPVAKLCRLPVEVERGAFQGGGDVKAENIHKK